MTHTTTKTKWSDGKKFAVCLTHDVDRVKKSYQYFTRFMRFFKKMQIKNAFNEIFDFLRFYFSENPKKDPYWNFERIMKVERKYNVRSTFFFLNEDKKMLNLFKPETWKLYLGRYSINHPEIVKTIKKLHLGRWEIGLHGSYNSYKDKDLLRKEKEELEEILGEQIYGIRQHYLNLEIPLTWELQESLGFKYDASFGFRDRAGFKDDKFFPFYPLNSAFLEIPLTVMDSALFSSDKGGEEIWCCIKNIIEIAEEQGGLLTVLWHQRAFNKIEFPNQGQTYERLIKLCKEKNAWITTAGEIEQWWNSRCVQRSSTHRQNNYC